MLITQDLEEQIQAFQNKCRRRMLCVSCREHKTNECTFQQANVLAGRQYLLSTVKRRKLSWFSPVCWQDTVPNGILQCEAKVVVTQEDRVNLERTISRNGQASRCCLSCALQPTVSYRWTTITGDATVGVPQRRLCVTGISLVSYYPSRLKLKVTVINKH